MDNWAAKKFAGSEFVIIAIIDWVINELNLITNQIRDGNC